MKHITVRWLHHPEQKKLPNKGPFTPVCHQCRKMPPEAFEFISTDGKKFFCHACMTAALALPDINGEKTHE